MEGENDKETSIGFKVHESEKRRWMELAEKNGLSLSRFIRRGVRAFAGEMENDVIARHDVVSMLDDLITRIRAVPSGNAHSYDRSLPVADGSEVEKSEHPPVFVEDKNTPEPTPSIAVREDEMEAIADAQDGTDASTESRDPVAGVERSGDLIAFIPFTVTKDDALRNSFLKMKEEINSTPGSHGGVRVDYSKEGGQKWKITAPSKAAREAFIAEFFKRGGK